MKDREKQIEEMAKGICRYVKGKLPSPDIRLIENENSILLKHSHNYGIAKELIKQGYQKYEKDSVILPKKLYELYMNEFNNYEVGKRNGSKETAEKIYNLVDKKLDLYKNGVIGGSLYDSGYQSAIYDVKRTIKELFGVEIKE